MKMGSVNGTPHKKRMSANKDVLPTTPKRSHSSRYPLSSPYSGKSPLPMPILLPSQYSIGRSSERPSSGRVGETGYSSGRRNRGKEHEYHVMTGRSSGVGSDNDSIDDDEYEGGMDNTARRIELFDKSVIREQPEIPPIGSALEEMPFFDKRRAREYVSALRGIHGKASSLKKINDTVVDLNESLGAYLFGLFQNAWCVNLNENMTAATLDKLEEVKRLKDEVAGLEKQVELARRNAIVREQRRKSTMPPPSVPRFQSNMPRKSELRASRTPRMADQGSVVKVQQQQKRGKFLRAGSRHATFRARALMSRRSDGSDNKQQKPGNNGLNLSYARKIENVPSLEDNSLSEASDSDTSEVKTLTNIMRLRGNAQNGGLLRRDSYRARESGGAGGGRVPETKERRTEPWEVQHRKPFR